MREFGKRAVVEVETQKRGSKFFSIPIGAVKICTAHSPTCYTNRTTRKIVNKRHIPSCRDRYCETSSLRKHFSDFEEPVLSNQHLPIDSLHSIL